MYDLNESCSELSLCEAAISFVILKPRRYILPHHHFIDELTCSTSHSWEVIGPRLAARPACFQRPCSPSKWQLQSECTKHRSGRAHAKMPSVVSSQWWDCNSLGWQYLCNFFKFYNKYEFEAGEVVVLLVSFLRNYKLQGLYPEATSVGGGGRPGTQGTTIPSWPSRPTFKSTTDVLAAWP